MPGMFVICRVVDLCTWNQSNAEFIVQLSTSWLTPVPGSQLLCSWMATFLLVHGKTGTQKNVLCNTSHEWGLSASIPTFFNWIKWHTSYSNWKCIKAFSAAIALGGRMFWRLQAEKQKHYKILCLDANSDHLFEDLHWGARSALISRTVLGVLVTLCTFQLAQVKFLQSSSGVCIFTACKTNGSPLEWRGLSAKRLNHRSSLIGLAGADLMSKDKSHE